MRFLNSIRNLIASWTGQIIIVIATFITRYYFINILGAEYLGIHGLFANVLSILSLAELGIGVSVGYSLYQPLADNNTKVLKAIMQLFRKFYFIVGIFILAVGIAITPFLSLFIKEMPANISEIYIDYILYVISIGSSYFFSYKVIIIIADQRKYINDLNYCFWFTLQNIAQIVLLLFTKSYTIYLVLQIMFIFFENLMISFIADRRYPFLKDNDSEELSKKEVDTIKKNSFAMIFQKLGTTVVNATDNLVLSKFIGLITVGIYANYYSILNAVNMLVSQLFSAITASVGSYNLSASRKDIEDVFQKTLLVNTWAYGFAAIALYQLFNPLIILWLGSDYLFPMNILFIICLNFYFNGMRQSVQNFRNALGIYWQDKFKPIIEAFINFAVSIALVHVWGTIGVFMGTLVSVLAVTIWWEPHTLYKNGFALPMKKYLIRFWLYFAVMITAFTLTTYVNTFITGSDVTDFVFRGIVTVLVSNLFFFLCYMWTNEFRDLVRMIASLVRNRSQNHNIKQ